MLRVKIEKTGGLRIQIFLWNNFIQPRYKKYVGSYGSVLKEHGAWIEVTSGLVFSRRTWTISGSKNGPGENLIIDSNLNMIDIYFPVH